MRSALWLLLILALMSGVIVAVTLIKAVAYVALVLVVLSIPFFAIYGSTAYRRRR